MTNRLNSVVIKLWLTILFIVTTVLILLSAALITFIQYYYTQQTENAIREDASRISHLVEQADNKTLAIEHSQQLIDGSGGVIIMANKSSSIKSSNSNTKDKMLEEIHKNSQFQRVFSQGKSTTQNITISKNGNSHSYILLGYPMKAQENANSKYSAVFIYQDLKSIEDTNNAITIIILSPPLYLSLFQQYLHSFYQIELLNLYDNLELKLLIFLKVIIQNRQVSQLKMR